MTWCHSQTDNFGKRQWIVEEESGPRSLSMYFCTWCCLINIIMDKNWMVVWNHVNVACLCRFFVPPTVREWRCIIILPAFFVCLNRQITCENLIVVSCWIFELVWTGLEACLHWSRCMYSLPAILKYATLWARGLCQSVCTLCHMYMFFLSVFPFKALLF